MPRWHGRFLGRKHARVRNLEKIETTGPGSDGLEEGNEDFALGRKSLNDMVPLNHVEDQGPGKDEDRRGDQNDFGMNGKFFLRFFHLLRHRNGWLQKTLVPT